MTGTARKPGGRPRKAVDLGRARELLATGLSLRETARRMGVGYGTLHRGITESKNGSRVIQNLGKGVL